MDEQLGWPFLIALAVVTLAAGVALEQGGVRRRLAAAMPPAERWFLRAALGLVLVIWWAVSLGELQAFSARTLLIAPAIVFLLRLPSRIFLSEPRSPRVRLLDLRWVVVVAIVATGALLYFPPYDVRLEARDPGVYYHAGVQLERDGSFGWTDRLLAEMTPAEREYWFPPTSRPGINESRRFVGMYLERRADAWAAPQALPVFPVFVAIGYAAFGTAGGLATTPVLAILGALALFFFVSRWRGPLAGALASMALATSFVQVWFARYAAAEFAAQALLCAGLYGLVCYRRHRDAAFGWLAAAGIGLSLMTKAELMVLVAPLTLLLLYDTARDGIVARDWRNFWLPLAALFAHMLLHARLLLWPYYYDLLLQLSLTPAAFSLLATASAIALAGALLLLHRLRQRLVWLVGRGGVIERSAPVAAVALVLFFAWGFGVRPGADWDGANFLQLGWAVSPWLVIAGLAAGTVLLVSPRSTRGRDAALVLIVAMIALGLYRRQIIPVLPWAYRRWIPLVLPGFLALAGSGIAAFVVDANRRPAWTRVAGRGLALLIVVGTVIHQWPNTAFYRHHEEMPGVGAVLSELDGKFEPGSLLIFEARTLRGLERFEANLAIERGFDVLRLPAPDVDGQMLRSAILRAARRGRSTYLLTTGYINGLLTPRVVSHDSFRFATQRLFEPGVRSFTYADYGEGLPRRVQQQTFGARIYRLGYEGVLAPLNGELDVGMWDEPYLFGEHFHDVEIEADGRTSRWTRGSAGVWLPGLTPRAQRLIVRAAANTPADFAPRVMTVKLNDMAVGTVTLQEGWHDYVWPILDAWELAAGAVPQLAIEVEGLRPIDAIPGSTDTRTIGVKIDKVGWQPVGPAAER